MKILSILFSLLTGVAAHAATHQHQHPADPPSTHGMLVVGKQTIFLSHLPMFHRPHDYQVILEAELDAASKQAYVESLTAHPDESVYTLVPERFSLPEMIAAPRPFKAELFRGHFERGGERIATNVTVQLKQVIHFEKFDPRAEQPHTSHQILFGKGTEWFMAHFITSAPDFDQIVKVRAVEKPTFPQATIVEILGQSNSSPLIADQKIETTAPEGKSSFKIEKSIYLEYGDLAH